MKKHKFHLHTILFFCVFATSQFAFSQLGFCQGNSGDTIFTETFGTGTTYGPPLPAGTTTYTFVGFNGPQDGEYTVGSNTFAYGWNMPSDHTPGDTNGKALIVNASFTTGEFYTTSINGLCENTTYEFSSWLLNILPNSGCGGNGIPVNVRFQIWDITDTNLLASGDTGSIFGTATPNWQQFGLVFQTLPAQTSVILKMINNGAGGCGNDLAIDDIEFKSCGDFISVVDPSNNTSASICSSEAPYSTTLTAIPDNSVFNDHFYQWQESTDNNIWTDIVGATNEDLLLTGVTSTTYYRAKVAEFASNLSNNDCITFSTTFAILITQLPNPPIIECWEMASVDAATCSWIVTGTQPPEPTGLECWESTTFNTTTCSWDITGTQPTQPTGLECWEITTFNNTTCSWDITGTQPMQPTGLECWEVTTFNNTTCSWEITGTQPIQPILECWETTTFNNTTCSWDITGTQPSQPTGLDCWEVATFNNTTCSWEITGTQPIQPILECWESVIFNNTSCIWEVSGTQPIQPILECWEVATFNNTSCAWEVSGTQPIINTPTPLEVCDDVLADGFAQFDLTSKDAEITGGDPTLLVSYHETTADANNDINPLGSPYNNIVQDIQTVYGRVEISAIAPNCAVIVELTLIVNPLPIIVSPTALEVCDDGISDGLTSIDISLKNSEITGGNSNYSVGYYLTQFDADNSINVLPIPYTNISNPQIIFVRVDDINTGCYSTTTLTLVVEQAPLASIPTPLSYCDADSDGFGVFTLEDATNEITSGDPSLTVSYHETMSDADNDVNPLSSPYNNIVEDQQTLYVRVESSTIATDCATIVELILIVNPTPDIEDPTPLEVCDDVLADGFAQFDLTSKDLEILDGLDPLQYIVTYYQTELNAESGINAILSPGNYTNTTAFIETLWVRVEDTSNGCYKLTTLDLIVNALPVLVQPTPLELCDDNNPGDEIEGFILEDSNAEMLAGQTGISFTYYESQLDADTGINPIVSPYLNTSNPQTIFVRATDDVTGCFVSTTATILLRVNPIPSPTAPTDLEVCDLDNDGFEEFDLESKTLEIIGGELDTVISYHETQSDADMDLNALVSPYTNIVMGEQMIYIRAENTITGCFNTSEVLMIRVLPSPEVPVSIDDYVICDTNSDGFAQFDLSSKDAEILGSQDPLDYVLTYHVTIGDAQSGNNPIANVTNYTNVLNPQTIYVRLVSNVNGCVTATGFFDILVELPPEAIQPTPLELCDDDIADEVTVFDLTLKDDQITAGNASWSVSYYETNADAQAGINAVDSGAYTNTSVGGAPANPQTLYVVVTDTDTGCVDYTTLTIRVLPNPTPSLDPDDIALCDDINPGDMEEAFDLTQNETYIINGEPGVTATYYETMQDAELGANAIVDPTLYTNTSTPQTIYVRVTNDLTDCYTLVTFDLIVNPLPAVVAVTDFILCELNTDGIDAFDLTMKDTEVLNGQDPALFTVSYHESQVDADALANALVSPYTNLMSPQQIFIAITNTDTGCSISTPSFNIEVQEAAEANSGMEPILEEICDDQMDDDGDLSNNSAQFDLTPVTVASDLDPTSVQAQVLDGQDPANYIVSYYETELDAELGVNPLPFLYENIVNPQVIYVRVDNDTMIDDGTGNMIDVSICYEVASLTLQVNPLPVFELDDSYILCVDTNGTEVLDVPVLDTGLTVPDYEFEWSLNGTPITGATDGSYVPIQGGMYSVLVSDGVTGCSSSVTTEVIESAPPTITLVDVTTDAFSELHILVVSVTGPGDYEYRLDDGPWQDSNVFTDVSAGDHDIDVRDKIGCGFASDSVTVMDYPKFFTPNGDSYNDTWNIKGIADQPSAKIYIFDRYGKLMKQISPSSEGWDGTYNGSPMPTSDYWFVVEYNEPNTGDRKEFKAHFTLKR